MNTAWGKIIKAGESVPLEIPDGDFLNISNFALKAQPNQKAEVFVEWQGGGKYLVCTLSYGSNSQFSPSLRFYSDCTGAAISVLGEGEVHVLGEIEENFDDSDSDELVDGFRSNSKRTVGAGGNFDEDEDSEDSEMDEGEDSEGSDQGEDEDEDDKIVTNGKKRKQNQIQQQSPPPPQQQKKAPQHQGKPQTQPQSEQKQQNKTQGKSGAKADKPKQPSVKKAKTEGGAEAAGGNESLKCSDCAKPFGSTQALQQHLKSKHSK
jgi:hypothetical protein